MSTWRGWSEAAQIPDRSITRDFFGVMISIFEQVSALQLHHWLGGG
jgi:hypothetical protein